MSGAPVILTDHARWQASRRGISESTVLEVATTPEQVLPTGPHREIRQARVSHPALGKTYVVRVVVDTTAETDRVITVYRSSKLNKYWGTS